MKRRDEGKTSLVEFLRSIKFARQNAVNTAEDLDCPTHFANLRQSARNGGDTSQEDSQLIRSAN
jgi:hypothetical protein